VHAHHAEGERMAGGEAAEAEESAGDGNLAALGEGEELGFGLGDEDAVAGEDDGRLAAAISSAACSMELASARSMGCGGARRARGGEVEGAEACCASLVMSTSTGRDGRRRRSGSLADGGRDVFRARDEEVVLGDGQGDAGDVDLLKRVGAEELGGDWPVMQTMG